MQIVLRKHPIEETLAQLIVRNDKGDTVIGSSFYVKYARPILGDAIAGQLEVLDLFTQTLHVTYDVSNVHIMLSEKEQRSP